MFVCLVVLVVCCWCTSAELDRPALGSDGDCGEVLWPGRPSAAHSPPGKAQNATNHRAQFRPSWDLKLAAQRRHRSRSLSTHQPLGLAIWLRSPGSQSGGGCCQLCNNTLSFCQTTIGLKYTLFSICLRFSSEIYHKNCREILYLQYSKFIFQIHHTYFTRLIILWQSEFLAPATCARGANRENELISAFLLFFVCLHSNVQPF